jgi:hypothetical protein
MKYETLEGNSLSSVGINNTPKFDGADVSFFTTSSFIYTLFFVAILLAAFYEYILVGIYRMEASEAGIHKSNEVFKRTTLGLLGVFSLFLIIFTINKGLLTGNVGLDALKYNGAAGGSSNTTSGIGSGSTSGGTSAACESTSATISKLQSPGGICGGITCSALSGCNYQSYLPVIDQAAGSDTELRKMIIVTMCRESKANPNAKHQNTNGSWDCGLMEINQNGTCENNPSSSSQAANIQEGVRKMKQKLASATQIYIGTPERSGAFASYNCCGGTTNPIAGFPNTIPKWACPINPGDTVTNMCFVKNYVCDLSACMKQL